MILLQFEVQTGWNDGDDTGSRIVGLGGTRRLGFCNVFNLFLYAQGGRWILEFLPRAVKPVTRQQVKGLFSSWLLVDRFVELIPRIFIAWKRFELALE